MTDDDFTDNEDNIEHTETERMLSPDQIAPDPMCVLEGILFASPEPLSAQALAARLPAGADLAVLLARLQEKYQDGIRLVERDGRWAFRTDPALRPFIAGERVEPRKLSRAALETLAIIAYHQPLTRAEIENIRGVATSKGTLDALMETGWIKPGKRRELPGRPLTWVTTPAFLDQFSLESLSALPGREDLKAAGLLDPRPAIDTVTLPSLFSEDGDDAVRPNPLHDEAADDEVGPHHYDTNQDDESEAA